MPAASLVVRVANQESHVEQTLRDLESLFNQSGTEGRLEVLLWTEGSSDQTEAILDRLTRRTGFKWIEASNADGVLSACQHPFVIWLDVSDPRRAHDLLGGLRRMLQTK